MKEMILLLVGAALVNNVVLSQFLGLCPFLGVSKRTEHNEVPEVFKGSPMVLVTAGLMAIAFSGFAGIL